MVPPLRHGGRTASGGSRSAATRTRPGSLPLVLVASLVLPGALAAQCLEEEVRPASAGPDAQYGFAMARSGDLIAVGAPGTGALGVAAGAVYTWQRFGADWQLAGILFGSGIGAGDRSGTSVGLSGETLIAGARGDDLVAPDAGSARIFDRIGGGWVEVATLVDPEGAALDEFGASVAIDGDLAAVGSPYDLVGGVERGSVCVFRRTNGVWGFEAKLLATGGAAGDLFGSALAIDGGTIAVGAPGTAGGGNAESGAVVVFARIGSSWVQTALLVAADAQPGDLLGAAVAIDGPLILAGAPYDSDAGLDAGAVVPFRSSGIVWVSEPQFFAPAPASGRHFGAAVDIDGAEVLVGEPFATVAGQFAAGRAHRFQDGGTSFAFLDTLDDPAASGSALLGSSVSIEDGEAFAGAYFDGSAGFSSGTVLRAVVGGADCDGSGVPDLCEIDDLLLADCDGDGVPDTCAVASGAAIDCDGNGIPDSCEIAAGAPDCDGDGQLDSCQVLIADCNANGLLDACEPDCNGNGAPDDCDIAGGSSLDCNANANPDECDLFFGLATDCDGNQVPDECDLASGAATDCNENGASDACDILLGASTDLDGDGLPDECGPRFIRGDANQDGAIDLADGITMLLYVTGGGPTPPCLVAADANGDGALDLADGITALSYLVGLGPPPPAPFPECGFEPAPPSGIGCAERPVCE